MPIASAVTDKAICQNLSALKASLNVSSQYQYATCGLEKSGQKLSRRQQARDQLLTSRTGDESFPARTHLAVEIELASYRSLPCLSRPSGRAPPSA